MSLDSNMFRIYCLIMAVQRHLDSLSFFLDMFFMHSNFGSNIYIYANKFDLTWKWQELWCAKTFSNCISKVFFEVYNFELVLKLVGFEFQILKTKFKLSKFQFRILNCNPNYPNFNSEFWIEILTIQISIQNSELKSKLSKFQFRINSELKFKLSKI
jgi:hypothetical protein